MFTQMALTFLGRSSLTNAQAFQNFTPGATDITATSDGNDPTALADILNTTLDNNGSRTCTHALPSISPAVDAVTNVSTCPPPAKDQRAVIRPHDRNGDGTCGWHRFLRVSLSHT
ncbi:MAG TPA: choice-of-anchor Q domain-containing protein [Gammaproteobacteria bacterium]|nr:choice-of-anchor Q domain-containing protein [Gammaproteobacteria bacterium]